jgi:hypothetical protein
VIAIVPDDMPRTTPELLTVAVPVLLLFQVPPDVAPLRLNAVVEPAHIVVVPLIVPATGRELMVTIA